MVSSSELEPEEDIHQDDEHASICIKQYSIAKDKGRREKISPKRYNTSNVISYAFRVAQDIEAEELKKFSEFCRRRDRAKWLTRIKE